MIYCVAIIAIGNGREHTSAYVVALSAQSTAPGRLPYHVNRITNEEFMLTTAQRAHYRRDGYIVIPDFKPADELARLRQRAEAIVDAFDPAESRAIFTTRDQARASDAWFLGSDNTVRCFFEEEAFGPDGRLKQAKALSINKIGHAMHDLDPVFDAFTRDAKLAAVARDLGLAQPQIWQSM